MIKMAGVDALAQLRGHIAAKRETRQHQRHIAMLGAGVVHHRLGVVHFTVAMVVSPPPLPTRASGAVAI